MHFHADGGGFPGTYCKSDLPGVRLEKISAVRALHTPDSIKQGRQFVGFIGYYRCIDFAGLSEPLVALTRKGAAFAWTDRQQVAFDTLKSCLLNAPIIGFPMEDGRFILDTDCLFAVGGVLTNFRRIGRSLLRTLAGVFGCLSGGIARRAGNLWWRSLYVYAGHTYVELSSLCIRITAHFGRCRNFGTVTVCWPAGTYAVGPVFSYIRVPARGAAC